MSQHKHKAHRRMNMGQNAPLRIASNDIPADRSAELSSEGSARIRDMANIMSAVRSANTLDAPYTNDDAEYSIRVLESQKNKGNLFDMPTMVLGVLQTPRFDAQGNDRAHLLVEIIAQKIGTTEPGTKYARKCLVEGVACHDTRISDAQSASVVTSLIPISPNMNPTQSVGIDTSMAAIDGYIATMRRPDLVTAGTRSPAQVLAADRAASPGVDVVKSNREQFRGCIRQDQSPALDLKNCTRIGARAAIYNIAQTGVSFVETDPLKLVPTPDLPKSVQDDFMRRFKQQKLEQLALAGTSLR
ncbi:MAG: hypothetical protein ACKVOE_02490 [Rickettsiales bacterium]